MTYYAVTNDPNELAHFGIKGMKWGVRKERPRHTGSRRSRSAAYKKASDKLGKLMKSGIRKAEAKWKVYKSPENVAKRAAERYAKQTDKALEKARKGKLKYGKLDDWQVQRITQRLAMENDARRLAETEKTFGKRLRESIGEGIISGIGRGTASYIDERFKGRGRTTADIKADERMTKYNSDRKMQERKARNKVNAEYYEEASRHGYKPKRFERQTDADRAKQLMAWNERDAREEERAKRQNAYYDTYFRTAAANKAKRRFPESNNNNNNNNNNNSNNNNNNGNGQAKPQLPVTVNVYTNNGRPTVTPVSRPHPRHTTTAPSVPTRTRKRRYGRT